MIYEIERLILVRAAALFLTGALCGAASAQEVGKASAVNPSATANLRTISIGASIEHKERIKTTSAGSVQLLFLDKTSMTIGPNSDLTIDEYVYDPNAGTGKLAATLSKGALRFVGGQISHNGEAEVKTASAVIGIRGGVALINQANVYTGYGSSTVTSGGNTVTLGPGEYTQTQGGGAAPTPPGPPPAGFVAGQVQTFQSVPGQTGGVSPGAASPAAVSRAETNATGSSSGTVAQVAPVSSSGTVQVAPTSTSSTSTASSQIAASVAQSTQTSTQSAVSTQIANQIQFGATAFAFTSTLCCGPNGPTPSSAVPFLPSDFATGPGIVSDVLGFRTASVNNPNRAAIFQDGIGINGVGAAQTSWAFLEAGAFVSDGSGGIVLQSGFSGSRRGSSTSGAGFAGSGIGALQNDITLGVDLLPTTANVRNLVVQNTPPITFSMLATEGLGNGTPTTSFNIDQTFTRTAVPTGVGDNRPAVTLTAFASGIITTVDHFGAGTTLAPGIGINGGGTIVLDPTLNRVQANFNVAPSQTTFFNNVAPPAESFAGASFQFGSLTLPFARSAYVDYNNFAARAAVNTPDLTQNVDIPVSTVSVTTAGGVSSPLTPDTHNGFLIVATPAIQTQIAPALSTTPVTFCQCDFTKWGFWSSSFGRTGQTSGHSINDFGNLMTWVAGQLPNISEVPLTGTATYDGHVVANIKNGANQYIAGGNFSNAVNFGAKTVNATVTNLDSTNYTGGGVISGSDPRNFSASLTGGGRTLSLAGNFFRGVAGPTAEMGGNVTIQGANYLGSGIFAAKAR